MTDAPERIYLQDCGEDDCEEPFSAHHEVTWCEDQIHERDVAYVRADKYDALAERADALHKALRGLADAVASYGEAQFFDGDEMDEDAGDAVQIALEHALTALAAPSAPKKGAA